MEPLPSQDNSIVDVIKNDDKSTENFPGLPVEIGLLVAEYLNRKNSAKIVQVCHHSNLFACQARQNFIENNGKSYETKPYLALSYLPF